MSLRFTATVATLGVWTGSNLRAEPSSPKLRRPRWSTKGVGEGRALAASAAAVSGGVLPVLRGTLACAAPPALRAALLRWCVKPKGLGGCRLGSSAASGGRPAATDRGRTAQGLSAGRANS